MENLELRMYGLVPYNISPIQQGIQYGHAVQEYNNEISLIKQDVNNYDSISINELNKFTKWSIEDKTFIILNGGTTNTNPNKLGTLNTHLATLKESGILTSEFYEPDLGDQLTAVVFLVDERVFNRDKYPDFDPGKNLIGKIFKSKRYKKWCRQFDANHDELNKIIFLRSFLRNFKLA